VNRTARTILALLLGGALTTAFLGTRRERARLGAVVALVVVLTAAWSETATATRSTRVSVERTAHVFMRGMTMTVPDDSWQVHEDHYGEFNLQEHTGPAKDTHLHFWLDPYAAATHGVILPNVKRTPAALVAWLRHDPRFVVTPPVRRRIAGGLVALSVDLDVAKTAPKEDPSCPAACVTYLVGKGARYHFEYGTGFDNPNRFYFANLHSGDARHTLVVAVDTLSPAAFAAAIPAVERILASVRLPATITTG